MAHILSFVTGKRSTPLKTARIERGKSLYGDHDVVTIDFRSKRKGRSGAAAIHGERKTVAAVLRGLADRIDPSPLPPAA